MRTLVFAAVAAAGMLAALAPAQAQGGCGPFGHRGWDGWCHRNHYGPPPPPPGWGWHRPWGWHGPRWGGYHGW